MDTSNFKEVFTSDEVKKLRAENEMLYYEAQRLDSLATDFAKRTEYWIGRCDSWQNDCEQLRQRVQELEQSLSRIVSYYDLAKSGSSLLSITKQAMAEHENTMFGEARKVLKKWTLETIRKRT